MAPTQVRFDESTAACIAEILMGDTAIKSIELFGSISREGQGKDIDLILITDEFTSAQFVAECAYLGAGYQTASLRRLAAVVALGNHFAHQLAVAMTILNKGPIESLDLFVFPENWRQVRDVLQRQMPHEDPEFMEHILADARVIAARK